MSRGAYPEQIRQLAVDLRGEGLTFRELSLRLRIPSSTIRTWFQDSDQQKAGLAKRRARAARRLPVAAHCVLCGAPMIAVTDDGHCGFCRDEIALGLRQDAA